MSNNYFNSVLNYSTDVYVPSNAQGLGASSHSNYIENSATNGEARTNIDFYGVLAKHTYFEGKKLILDHQYVHSRVMNSTNWDHIEKSIINNMTHYVDENVAIDQYLNEAKLFVAGVKNTKMLLLLRELFIAEEGKMSFCKINVKNMNARMKYCLPLTYLHDFGSFSGPESFRAMASDDSSGFTLSNRKRGRSESDSAARPTIDKKYQTIIKALLKYSTNQDIFTSEISKLNDKQFKLVSEPDKWIAAMVARHGYLMIAYLNRCINNLVAGYLEKLKAQQNWGQLELLRSYADDELNVSALRSILQDISIRPATGIKSRTNSQLAKMMISAKRKKTNEGHKSHSNSLQPSAESSMSAVIGEVKPVGWLLNTIAQTPNVARELNSQHCSERKDDGFFELIEPYLQREISASAQGSLNAPMQLSDPLQLAAHATSNLSGEETLSPPTCTSSSTFSSTSTFTSASTLAQSQLALVADNLAGAQLQQAYKEWSLDNLL